MDDDVQMEEFQPANDSTELQPVQQYESDVPGTVGPPRDEKRDDVVVNLVDEEDVDDPNAPLVAVIDYLDATNSTLLSSWPGFIFRMMVTGIYLLAILVGLGFAINGLLVLFFSFFRGEILNNEQPRTALLFIAILTAIPAIGYVLSIWLTRLVDLAKGSWALDYTDFYLVLSNCGSYRVTPAPKSRTIGDILAFLGPIIGTFVGGLFSFLDNDSAVEITQYGLFTGVGVALLVSILFFLLNLVAAARSARFPLVPTIPEPDKSAGCAYIIFGLGRWWKPIIDDPDREHVTPGIVRFKQTLSFFFFMLFVAWMIMGFQDTDRFKERWMYLPLPVFFVLSLYLVISAADDMDNDEDFETDHDRRVAEFRKKTIRVCVFGLAVVLILAAVYRLISQEFFGILVVVGVGCVVMLVLAVWITPHLSCCFNCCHPEDMDEMEDEAENEHLESIGVPSLFKRWGRAFGRLLPGARRRHGSRHLWDYLRMLLIFIMVALYITGIVAAFSYLGGWSSIVGWGMVFAFVTAPVLKDMESDNHDSIMNVFVSLLVILGVSIVMLGSQVQDPEPGEPVALVNTTFIVDPKMKYSVCGMTWHGLDVIDATLLTKLAYVPVEKNLLATDLEAWFPGRFTYELLDTSPSKVVAFHEINTNLTVVSIRGTTKLSDWIEDMDLFMESVLVMPLAPFMPANLTASVVEAFSIFESALPQEGRAYYFDIEDALHDLMAKHTDREFMIMGHSLGGGLAQILGARNKIRAVTFSPPGPLYGREVFDFSYHDYNTQGVSIIPRKDAVPKVGAHAGAIHNIDCAYNSLTCHFLDTTFCELVQRCGDSKNRSMKSAKCHSDEPWLKN